MRDFKINGARRTEEVLPTMNLACVKNKQGVDLALIVLLIGVGFILTMPPQSLYFSFPAKQPPSVAPLLPNFVYAHKSLSTTSDT